MSATGTELKISVLSELTATGAVAGGGASCGSGTAGAIVGGGNAGAMSKGCDAAGGFVGMTDTTPVEAVEFNIDGGSIATALVVDGGVAGDVAGSGATVGTVGITGGATLLFCAGMDVEKGDDATEACTGTAAEAAMTEGDSVAGALLKPADGWTADTTTADCTLGAVNISSVLL